MLSRFIVAGAGLLLLAAVAFAAVVCFGPGSEPAPTATPPPRAAAAATATIDNQCTPVNQRAPGQSAALPPVRDVAADRIPATQGNPLQSPGQSPRPQPQPTVRPPATATPPAQPTPVLTATVPARGTPAATVTPQPTVPAKTTPTAPPDATPTAAPPAAPAQATAFNLTYVRAEGGSRSTLTIRPDGLAQWQTPASCRETRLTPADLQQLASELAASRFFNLLETYPPAGAAAGATYSIVYAQDGRSTSVTWTDASVIPPGLQAARLATESVIRRMDR